MRRRLLMVIFSTVFILTAYVLAFGIDKQPVNPLSGIETVLPGNSHIALRGMNFTCATAYMAYYAEYLVCNVRSLNPNLMNVIVVLNQQIIESVSISPVRGRITLGDMVALWGEPERYRTHRKLSRVFWPGRSITVMNGDYRLTMFSRVLSIQIYE